MSKKNKPNLTKYVFRCSVLLMALTAYHLIEQHDPTARVEIAASGVGLTPKTDTMIMATKNHDEWVRPLPTLPAGHRYGIGPEIYAGGQLDADGMEAFLGSFQLIRHVIRLDAEESAQAILSVRHEEIVCGWAGIDFHLFNIEGKNRLNEAALQRIDSLMDGGGVYVHCRNGRHRAMLVLGRYYARQGYTWPTIVELLNWQKIINDKRYDEYTYNLWKYVEQFNHPIKN